MELRLRSRGFHPEKIVAYFQWRGEGASGRRKRSLQPRGRDHVLGLSAAELRQDRLQVWFVAEPGDVRLGSPSRPIEIRVR